jgi:hypothetical protein
VKNGIEIYITPEGGDIRVGPQFQALLDELTADLAKSRRTKAYKLAATRRQRIETAIEIMALAAWTAGETLDATP